MKYARNYYIGMGLMGGGYIISFAALAGENYGLATIGSLMVITGFVYQIESHSHIGKAGRILRNSNIPKLSSITPASSGIGVAFNFK